MEVRADMDTHGRHCYCQRAIREGWYGKFLSELLAHQLSTETGVLLFGMYIWMLIRIWRPESAGQAIAISLVWLGMTGSFE